MDSGEASYASVAAHWDEPKAPVFKTTISALLRKNLQFHFFRAHETTLESPKLKNNLATGMTKTSSSSQGCRSVKISIQQDGIGKHSENIQPFRG